MPNFENWGSRLKSLLWAQHVHSYHTVHILQCTTTLYVCAGDVCDSCESSHLSLGPQSSRHCCQARDSAPRGRGPGEGSAASECGSGGRRQHEPCLDHHRSLQPHQGHSHTHTHTQDYTYIQHYIIHKYTTHTCCKFSINVQCAL